MSNLNWLCAVLGAWVALGAWANPTNPSAAQEQRILEKIRVEIEKSYPEAKINLSTKIRWVAGEPEQAPAVVSFLSDNGKGEAQITADGKEGWISFSAIYPARVAVKRVRPGERLDPGNFKVQEINLAVGQAREYRGLIVPIDVELSQMESRQTILEGQFLVSSAIQKMPDVRRGDSVRVHIVSGDLSLNTSGVAQEPANVRGQIRVLTQKSKRELTGVLVDGGVVEIHL